MPILRDIVARLSLELDKRGFAAADRRVDEVVSNLNKAPVAANAALASIGQFFGVAAVGFAGLKLVELGSDVNETLNVLDSSFGESSEAVQAWADNFANAAGRSEFGMREMSATLGAVLNPLMERNQEVAAEMSTTLSELAVDLGSFFNVADDNALNALRSAITGEAEAVKRFGIVMNEATLAAFALSEGIRGNVKDMSIAEKTALRYEFILNQTALAQGDAILTSEGWANASKGLLTALKDLGSRIGLTLLPFAEKVVIAGRNATRAFLEWQKGTQLLKAGLIVLGAVGTSVAVGLLVAWGPVIIPILKFIAVLTFAALALGDFLTFLDRGDSVIGRFIDSMFGPGSASAAVDHLFEAWDKLNHFWDATVVPNIRVVADSMSEAAKQARADFGAFFSDVGKWVKSALGSLQTFVGAVKSAFATAERFGFKLASGDFEGARKEARRLSFSTAGSEATVPDPTALASFAPQSPNMTIDNSVIVQVQGNATAADAGRIAAVTSQAQATNNRRTQAALTQEKGA